MATIAENIEAMAELVAKVKRQSRLSETTILRIVDMNFALAQSNGTPTFGGDEQFLPDIPESDEFSGVPEGQLELFPTDAIEGDEEVLAAVAAPEEEK